MNSMTTKYMKQKQNWRGKKKSNRVEAYIILSVIMLIYQTEKINKDTENLTNTINQLDLTTYTACSFQQQQDNILLKGMWVIFQDRVYVRPQMQSQGIWNFIRSIFFDKAEWSYKSVTSEMGRFSDLWKLTHSNNQWIKEEITREIRKYLETSENKNTCQNLCQSYLNL